MSFSNEEYADMHLIYGEAGRNAALARRIYRERFTSRRLPNQRTFENVDRSLRERGTFNPMLSERGRSQGRIHVSDQILDLIAREPELSTRRVAARLQIPHVTVWRVLHNEGLHPFHFQPVQSLEEADPVVRLDFCRFVQRKILINESFIRHICFTDEATFTRDGIFNLHNLHTWASENPHGILEARHQRGFKINVWCGIIGDTLLGPYELGTVNEENYLTFLRNGFQDLLDENISLAILRNMWFMHDGAPAHFSRSVRRYLDENFEGQWIGRGGPVRWPPRSPDLTPIDFYLWGHLKAMVYNRAIESREELWSRIQAGCDEIRSNRSIFLRIRTNLVRRINACIEMEGRHFEHLL